MSTPTLMPDVAAWPVADAAEYRRRRSWLAQYEQLRLVGLRDYEAAAEMGISAAMLCRVKQAWAMVQESGDHRLLLPGKSTGRPGLTNLQPKESEELRRRFIQVNLRRGYGSMTYAARSAAKDPESPLSPETRAAILKPRASKHTLPRNVRRAMRGADGAVAEYRDPREAKLSGIYAPGMLRMTNDPITGELRRLWPGERWCADDGSVNFMVCVPWPWGGDPCSDKFGVRLGRYQLLAVTDDAEDFCLGFSYTMRDRDSYRGDDVVALLHGVIAARGYTPRQMVLEGGAWQSQRVLEFMRAAGIEIVNAKGRPHNKLIESWFNRLWTPLSEHIGGQIGRFRGEMRREAQLVEQCRRGTLDPRRVFPMLDTALNAITWAVDYVNGETAHSKDYGTWIPAEYHAAGLSAHPRPAYAGDLAYLAARVRERRMIRRRGMVAVRTEGPLGQAHTYIFASAELAAWNGAEVWVHFDPMQSPVQAVITLARDCRETPAGTVLERRAPCINAAPEVLRDEARGGWVVGWSEGLSEALRVKRAAHLAVRRELRVLGLDGNRVAAASEVSAPEGVAKDLAVEMVEEARELPKVLTREELAAS